MKHLLHTSFLLATLYVTNTKSGKVDVPADYYWREYDGEIPRDAVSVHQEDAEPVYIGQIFVRNYGLFVGKIVSGVTEVEFQGYGVRKATAENGIIKILCSQHRENFRWIPTDANRFTEDTQGTHLVRGGYNGIENEIYYVGKTVHEGDTKIGLVTLTSREFFYVHNETFFIRTDKNYNILVYDYKNSIYDTDKSFW